MPALVGWRSVVRRSRTRVGIDDRDDDDDDDDDGATAGRRLMPAIE